MIHQQIGSGSYDTFRQRVRRHRRTDILKAAAALNVQLERAEFYDEPSSDPSDYLQPFNLAGVARTALIAANDHRKKPVTIVDLREMCAMYFNIVNEPDSDDSLDHRSLRSIFNPLVYEQFPYQSSVAYDVGRSQSLLVDHAGRCSTARQPGAWAGHLGVPLEMFLRLGFAMYVAALSNGGVINREVLRMDHVAPIFTPLTPDEGLAIISNWFAATPEQHRAVGSAAEVRGAEKWSFNPLVEKPMVALPNGDYVMPSPRLVVNRITPTSLYFIGLASFGESFPDSLGCLFEEYVGTQLRLLNHAEVRPEITYDSHQKTIDFFVITPEVVLLVEAKASRPTEATRFGIPPGDADIKNKIGKAYSQIDSTADLLRTGHMDLAEIPNDRPICGLVVTLEPFHLINTLVYADLLTPPSVPTTVASSSELEAVVTALSDEPETGARLLNALTTEPVRSLKHAIIDPSIGNNPILYDAWKRFTAPWSEQYALDLHRGAGEVELDDSDLGVVR